MAGGSACYYAAAWLLIGSRVHCSEFRKCRKQLIFVFKPFKIPSSGDKQNSSDEDSESDTDRYDQQYTYTYIQTYTNTITTELCGIVTLTFRLTDRHMLYSIRSIFSHLFALSSTVSVHFT